MKYLDESSQQLFQRLSSLPTEEQGNGYRLGIVRNEYCRQYQVPADARNDMMLSCRLLCHSRSWKGYYLHRENPLFLSIGVICSGEQWVRCGSEYRIMEAGDVMLLPPGIDHELTTPLRCNKIGIQIEGYALAGILESSKLAQGTFISLKALDLLTGLFSHLGNALQETFAPIARRQVSNLCFEIIQYLVSPESEQHQPAPLAAALEIIGRSYSQKLLISDIATGAGISESRLNRLFREYLDVTPHHYLTLLRMRQADAMLRQGGLLVKEVAAKVGYDNQHNFSTEFKKFFGYPPRHLQSTEIE